MILQHWLDPKKKVCRQIRGGAPITLYLGVKFYAADPCRLVEEITRYQFFLQVKQDVLQGRLPVTQDLAVELAALSLQCKYSEVPNRRACSLSFFRFSFHPARNFSCNKQKIPPCSFINLLSNKQAGWHFFSKPARLFRSALLLGTSE